MPLTPIVGLNFRGEARPSSRITAAINEYMSNSTHNISKILMDLAGAAETVLYPTAKGRAAEKNPKLDSAQRSLLERIDGFRSLEQLLAMSGDLIGVHAALGTLLMTGCVSTDSKPQADVPVVATEPPLVRAAAPAPAAVRAPAAAQIAPAPLARAKVPAAVPAPTKVIAPVSKPIPISAPVAQSAPVAFTELDNAKRVLSHEAKMVFGNSASKVQPRIDACGSIEEIYDLIVKFQQHLTNTGKANPDVFLDRLTKGIASARKQAPAAQSPAR